MTRDAQEQEVTGASAESVVLYDQAVHALTLVCGDRTVGSGDPSYVLDTFCRTDLGPGRDLPDLVTSGLATAYDASMLFLVTGALPGKGSMEELQRVVGLVPGDLWAGVFRCGAAAESGLAEYAGRPILTLSALGQLPAAMAEVVR